MHINQPNQSLRIGGFLLIVTSIIGCRGGVSGVDFEDFRNSVAKRAGPNAIECSALSDPNQCIANSFQSATPAYTVYESYGIDSRLGSGLALTKDSKVFFMKFDSDPSGAGRPNNGLISTRECINPQLSGPGVGSFSCE